MIREQWGHHTTLAVATGSKEEVESDVERYFKEFIPAGYGTRVVQEPKDLGGGIWEAKLSRSSSCE